MFRKYFHEIILFLTVLITRLPFVSHYLYSWDAVQLSLALQKFSLQQHQPHPPGYILYVFLGKIFNFIFFDANLAYVIISIVATIFTVIVFYYFCSLFFDNKKFAFWLSFILIFNPYFWFFGEVASTYIFDALFSVIFVFLSLLIIKSKKVKYLYWFSFFLACAGGIRESLLLLFLPLWFFVSIFLIKNKSINFKRLGYSIIIGFSSFLVWFIPLIYLSDGWHNYLSVTNWQLSHAVSVTSIFQIASWQFFLANLKSIIKVTIIILNVLILLPFFIFYSQNKEQIKSIFTRPNIILFLLWLLPSYFFYSLVHFGNPGYLMTVALSLVVLFSAPLFFIFKTGKLKIFFFITMCVCLLEVYSFCFGGHFFIKPYMGNKIYNLNLWYTKFSYQGITDFDGLMANYRGEISQFNPANTILITEKSFQYRLEGQDEWISNTGEYFRHLEYYLPDYNLYELFGNNKNPQYFHIKNRSALKIIYARKIFIPRQVDKIIIIADNIDKEVIKQSGAYRFGNLFIIDLKNKDKVEYYFYEFIKN